MEKIFQQKKKEQRKRKIKVKPFFAGPGQGHALPLHTQQYGIYEHEIIYTKLTVNIPSKKAK